MSVDWRQHNGSREPVTAGWVGSSFGSVGHARVSYSPRGALLGCLVAAAVTVAGCSSPTDGQLSEPTATANSTTARVPSSDPIRATVDEEASTVQQPPSSDDAVAAWLFMWDAAELVVIDADAAEARIGAVAAPDVYSRLDATFNPDVAVTEGGVTNSRRTFDNHPQVTEMADGSVRIDDCLFVHPLITAPSVWYSGVLELVDGAWQVQTLTPEYLLGCTPADMQEAVFHGYGSYWDARLEFWDPPDPDHPLVAATTTGSFKDFLSGLLAEDREKGRALRGRSTNFPEIIEVHSEFQVVIFDCQLQDTARGLFDIETSERLDGVPPVVEGQRDVKRVTMRLVDGVWKVDDIQGQENRACEHAPTTRALPSI